MKRIFKVLLAVLVCCSGTAFAGNGIVVKATKGYSADLEVKVSEFKLEEVQVLGRKAVSLTIPGGNVTFDKNAPALPYLSAMVMVDPMRKPTITVEKLQSEVIDLDAPIVPSKGNFTRDISPDSVPYVYGKSYTQDQWIPSDKDLAKIDAPYIFRDVRGARLLVNPIQYNPIKNQIRIHRSLKVTLSTGAIDSDNVKKGPVEITKSFEPIYRKTFINFDSATRRLPRLNENGRLLIICHDEFLKAIQPFVAWKMKTGLNVVVAKTSEVGKTNTEVQAFILEEFNKGGLTHIMLVGDAEQIPTNKGVKERADSDPCYVKLAGDDHVPDAIISRVSATNEKEVAYQIAKFVNYEQFPTTDASWYTKGIGIGSDEGNPKDREYIEKTRIALLAKMFKDIAQIYDPGATAAMVTKAVNDGVSLINYLGHGSGTSWGTTRFNNTNASQLKNGWKMPVIWDVACVNGKFVNFTGFGEAWMRSGDIENPAGAVSYAGATTNMEWVPPIWVQVEFNQNYIANELYRTTGGIFFNGIMKGLELYGTEPKGSGVMMLEQWNLFGDGTLLVRFKAPCSAKVATAATKEAEKATVSVKVTDENGKPLSNARVTVYTDRFEAVSTGDTNDEGEAVVTVVTDRTEAFVTVIGADLIPVVDQKITF